MSHDEALAETKKHLHLIGKEFKLPDGETESIKAVVPWKEPDGSWRTHVCFYNWGEDNPDGKISHMSIEEFLETYQQIS
jgi:hypothetical protein